MRFKKPGATFALSSLLLLSQMVSPEQAKAQAMMEYGGLMAMPKGVPSGNTVNMLTNPYRSINGKFPGNGTSNSNSGGSGTGEAPAATPGQAGGSNSAMSVDALGTITLDPKKAQILGAQALKQFEQAKAKMAAKPQDLKGAEKVLREAINTRNSIWGYDDPMMPTMLTLMGEIYANQKHVSESEACFKNALVYITKKQGSGSFDRLDTLAKLGALYNDNGNPKEALPYFQQVAQIKERQHGPLDIATLKAKLHWANVSAAAGKPDAATIYTGLQANLEQSDKEKAGYKEVQSEFVKSYGAFLTKAGKSEEANDLEKRASSPAPEPKAVTVEPSTKAGDVAASPSINPAVNSSANSSTAAASTSTKSALGEMTMEEMINAETALNKKKSKSKD